MSQRSARNRYGAAKARLKNQVDAQAEKIRRLEAENEELRNDLAAALADQRKPEDLTQVRGLEA